MSKHWYGFYHGKSGRAFFSSPVASNGFVYYSGDNGGCMYAVDGKTGQIKWTFNNEYIYECYLLTVSDGFVYFGGINGYLYALDGKSGQLKWKQKFNIISGSRAVSFDGILYFGSDDGYLYAVDGKTGQENIKGDPYSSPVVSNGIVYYGGSDGYLYALDSKNGQELWKHTFKFRSRPTVIVSDGYVYFGSDNGYLYAVNGETGQEKWSFNIKGDVFFSSLTVVDGILYFGISDTSHLYAVKTRINE